MWNKIILLNFGRLMSQKIYHITHIDNLPGIIRDGVLWSDAKRLENRLDCEIVGMQDIKRRRLVELEVSCHPGTKVGQYVPFYFCPRSVMLYILYRANHVEITYRGGQVPILHLQADLHAVIRWAESNHVPWAFSDRNAGSRFASFFNEIDKLSQLDWEAVRNSDFRDPQVKEGKQAEFLVLNAFPWNLVEYIGVINTKLYNQVQGVLTSASHKPQAGIQTGWYY